MLLSQEHGWQLCRWGAGWQLNAGTREGQKPRAGFSSAASAAPGAHLLGNSSAGCRENTGFLSLKKQKIHLNRSVLPSVLNHLENLSLT